MYFIIFFSLSKCKEGDVINGIRLFTDLILKWIGSDSKLDLLYKFLPEFFKVQRVIVF